MVNDGLRRLTLKENWGSLGLLTNLQKGVQIKDRITENPSKRRPEEESILWEKGHPCNRGKGGGGENIQPLPKKTGTSVDPNALSNVGGGKESEREGG